MGSPLSHILAGIYMHYFGTASLRKISHFLDVLRWWDIYADWHLSPQGWSHFTNYEPRPPSKLISNLHTKLKTMVYSLFLIHLFSAPTKASQHLFFGKKLLFSYTRSRHPLSQEMVISIKVIIMLLTVNLLSLLYQIIVNYCQIKWHPLLPGKKDKRVSLHCFRNRGINSFYTHISISNYFFI